MARRQRVPRHKEHGRKRNKNPKLSPFQREQKRKRMANQPPVSFGKNGTQRDYPISQRAVMEFLMAKKRRLEERRQQKQEEQRVKNEEEGEERRPTATASGAGVSETNGGASTSPGTPSLGPQVAPPAATAPAAAGTKEARAKRAKKTSLMAPVALNAEIAASLARPIMAFKTLARGEGGQEENTVESIIARKKEKKHRKKAEARRERLREMLRETEEQLREEVLSTKGGKKRRRQDPVDAKDAAFEKQLKRMQKEKVEEEEAKKRAAGKNSHEDRSEAGSTKKKRKRITFSDGGASSGGDAPHSAMRYPNDKGAKVPRDFCELVDVVRYGERVEAPPVFDVIPRHDASITRLANRMESSSRKSFKDKAAPSQKERLQLLSSVGGAGEERRLERLGLGPVHAPAAAARPAGAPRKLSKEEEMQRLREAVMDAYRRKKRTGAEARKGVDMHHQFPVFS